MKRAFLTIAVIATYAVCTGGAHAATVAELQAQLQVLSAQFSALQSQTQATVASQNIATSCPNLVRNLSRGSRGLDVTQLQQFLILQNLLAPDGATGFFGVMTENALKEWQSKNSIASSGTPATTGYGAVGPRTRAVLMRCAVSVNTPTAPPTHSFTIPPNTPSASTGPTALIASTTPANPTTSVSCIPLAPQTKTLSCAAGQAGSIMQTRTSSCLSGAKSPTWNEWVTNTNTCVVVTAQPAQSDPSSIASLDVPTFIKTAYLYFLDRSVGVDEYTGAVAFLNAQQNPTPRLSVLYSFYTSTEFQTRNGLASKSNVEWTRFMYTKILRVTGDPAMLDATGYNSILARLNAGEGRDEVAKTFFFSSLFAPAFMSRLTHYDLSWNGVIDMGTVVSAFADKHPHESKVVSLRKNTGAAALMTTDRITERRSGDLIVQITQYSNNAWTIYSPVQITANMVGYSGTFVKPDSTENPPTYWDMNPIANRYMTVNDTGRQALANNTTYIQAGYPSSMVKTAVGSGPLATKIKEFGVKDFGGTIGTRWYVSQITDLSVLPTYTAEWVAFDLGPAQGVYDPEYGVLEYGHTNIPGLNPADYTYVHFGAVDKYEPHGSVLNYFSF